jgi:integrase/recombinase XerD
MYTEAVRRFATAHLLRETGCASWEQVCGQDVQRWMVWLLSRYSDSYASNQYRALQQFFRWWAEEVDRPDPMAGLRAPMVRGKLIPVFTSGELPELEKACQGRTFAQRRDYAMDMRRELHDLELRHAREEWRGSIAMSTDGWRRSSRCPTLR